MDANFCKLLRHLPGANPGSLAISDHLQKEAFAPIDPKRLRSVELALCFSEFTTSGYLVWQHPGSFWECMGKAYRES
jgi:hypothetical protein